eukprot:CAMPEP_0175146018 /NCGR_PEP_ID=MMETSP0087-20121206/15124_1 /TAXON_ID=136419 /ORGANISM="Unknown Unknown, Strain D1" /LENGTH=1336 /DNA_ID=CAMNT_0016430891 /DNA_START=33 /DNA_END=4041 /DNA_ORIENTATION=+
MAPRIRTILLLVGAHLALAVFQPTYTAFNQVITITDAMFKTQPLHLDITGIQPGGDGTAPDLTRTVTSGVVATAQLQVVHSVKTVPTTPINKFPATVTVTYALKPSFGRDTVKVFLADSKGGYTEIILQFVRQSSAPSKAPTAPTKRTCIGVVNANPTNCDAWAKDGYCLVGPTPDHWAYQSYMLTNCALACCTHSYSKSPTQSPVTVPTVFQLPPIPPSRAPTSRSPTRSPTIPTASPTAPSHSPTPVPVDWDCEWNPWTVWGACTASCGGGFQGRTRSVKRQHGGKGEVCKTADGFEQRECNPFPCSEIHKPFFLVPKVLSVVKDSPPFTVEVRDVYAGQGVSLSAIRFSVFSSNPAVVQGAVNVTYFSPAFSGSLGIALVPGATGNSTITVIADTAKAGSAPTPNSRFSSSINLVVAESVPPSFSSPPALVKIKITEKTAHHVDITGIQAGPADNNENSLENVTLSAVSDSDALRVLFSPAPVTAVSGTYPAKATMQLVLQQSSEHIKSLLTATTPHHNAHVVVTATDSAGKSFSSKSITVEIDGIGDDCAYGFWSEWSPCSSSCSHAMQSRTRTIVRQATSSLGRPCNTTLLKEVRSCLHPACLRASLDSLPTVYYELGAGGGHTYEQMVSGISVGNSTHKLAGPVLVTAVSDNTALVNSPEVTYTSPSSVAVLTYSVAKGLSGLARINVTVSSSAYNLTALRVFRVIVRKGPTSLLPTIDPFSFRVDRIDQHSRSIFVSVPITGLSPGNSTDEHMSEGLTLTTSVTAPNMVRNVTILPSSYLEPEHGFPSVLYLSYIPVGAGKLGIEVKATDTEGKSAQQTLTLQVLNPVVSNSPTTHKPTSQPTVWSQDCKYSAWGDYSACSSACGFGASKRTRTIVAIHLGNGKPCEQRMLTEFRECSGFGVCHVPRINAIADVLLSQAQAQAEQVIPLTGINDGESTPMQSLVVSSAAVVQGTGLSMLQPGYPKVSYTSPQSAGSLKLAFYPGLGGSAVVNVVVTDNTGLSTSTNFTVTVQEGVVDCAVGWGEWSACSKTCDQGTQTRVEAVVTPAKNGGRACPALQTQTRACQTSPCNQDCVMGWGEWGRCSVTCGRGVQARAMVILEKPIGSGRACPNPVRETRSCAAAVACPVDCRFVWGPFGPCSASCTGGLRNAVQMREAVVVAQPSAGGQACPGPEFRQCAGLPPCQANCVKTWGAWGTCSVQCGGGVQKRTEVVSVAAVSGGTCAELKTEQRACNQNLCAVGSTGAVLASAAAGTSSSTVVPALRAALSTHREAVAARLTACPTATAARSTHPYASLPPATGAAPAGAVELWQAVSTVAVAAIVGVTLCVW